MGLTVARHLNFLLRSVSFILLNAIFEYGIRVEYRHLL